MTFTGAMACVIGMALWVWGLGMYLIHLKNKNRDSE